MLSLCTHSAMTAKVMKIFNAPKLTVKGIWYHILHRYTVEITLEQRYLGMKVSLDQFFEQAPNGFLQSLTNAGNGNMTSILLPIILISKLWCLFNGVIAVYAEMSVLLLFPLFRFYLSSCSENK